MNFEVSFYELAPRGTLNHRSRGLSSRKGFLVRTIKDGCFGYGDVHPWPEFDNISLEDHLVSLKTQKPTPIVKRSIECCDLDWTARRAHVSLFSEMSSVNCHLNADIFALENEPIWLNSSKAEVLILKLKMGVDIDREVSILNRVQLESNLRLRLDFNFFFSHWKSFTDFLSKLNPDVIEKIDFIEDPFAYDGKSWRKISEDWEIQLALDQVDLNGLKEYSGISVFVFKPAWQPVDIFEKILKDGDQDIVVTSAMDHPIGQCFAAYQAAHLQKKFPEKKWRVHGLNSHHLYKENEFSRHLANRGTSFQFPSGPGLGFEEELMGLKWESL